MTASKNTLNVVKAGVALRLFFLWNFPAMKSVYILEMILFSPLNAALVI